MLRRPSVRHHTSSSSSSTISNIFFSETAGPIKAKFYLKHHWGGGKVALGYGPDRTGTLVSMATNSSHRVIIGKHKKNFFSETMRPRAFIFCV